MTGADMRSQRLVESGEEVRAGDRRNVEIAFMRERFDRLRQACGVALLLCQMTRGTSFMANQSCRTPRAKGRAARTRPKRPRQIDRNPERVRRIVRFS